MPLQNRVTPFGEIIATQQRGMFMGNRGGQIHDIATKSLGGRRWASKAWICCLTAFKDRQRAVMGASYTELFFLDEVTAFAAGHRPCFECRRHDSLAFSDLWRTARDLTERPRAAEMDAVLHRERLDGKSKRTHPANLKDLPNGCAINLDGEAWALNGDRLLRWTAGGYIEARPRNILGPADVLTPPSIVAVLRAGYRPVWHPSAETTT